MQKIDLYEIDVTSVKDMHNQLLISQFGILYFAYVGRFYIDYMSSQFIK